MTTVAYLRGLPRGRHRPPLDPSCATRRVPGLRRLTDAVHAEGAAVAAQIGHAGPVANPRLQPAPAPCRPRARSASLGYRMNRRGRRRRHRPHHRRLRAGGRGLRRRGRLRRHRGPPRPQLPAERVPQPEAQPAHATSGAAASRTAPASPARCVRAVREAVGSAVAVTAKLNMADGVRGGLWLDESVAVAAAARGRRRARRARAHRRQLARQPDVPLPRRGAAARSSPPRCRRSPALGFRLVGRRFLRAYPFEEAFFLPYARQFRAALRPAAHPARRHQPARHHRARRWPRASTSWPWPGRCSASPTWSNRMRDGRRHRVAVHPLQQVHADHLQRHPLRARRERLDQLGDGPLDRARGVAELGGGLGAVDGRVGPAAPGATPA